MAFFWSTVGLTGRLVLQLQQDRLWTHWVDLAFNKFDANGDGFLSLEEILQHLPAELAGASTQDRILEVCPPCRLREGHASNACPALNENET